MRTVVFIHGLWLHATSWSNWMNYFGENGYETMAVNWPGDSATVAECRANPDKIANRGVLEIADSIAKTIATLPEPPLLIGHSFGGLITQILHGRGLGAAAVAIDPAPIKGVWQLPFSALKASFPVLGNPFNLTKSHSRTFDQYKFGFANMLSEDEARDLYERLFIPAPCRPLFQAGFASIAGNETKVNTENTTRGPLLITGGAEDNIAPPIFGEASLKKYNKQVVTEYKLFEGKGHSLILDHGWKDVAEYSLTWLKSKGFN